MAKMHSCQFSYSLYYYYIIFIISQLTSIRTSEFLCLLSIITGVWVVEGRRSCGQELRNKTLLSAPHQNQRKCLIISGNSKHFSFSKIQNNNSSLRVEGGSPPKKVHLKSYSFCELKPQESIRQPFLGLK